MASLQELKELADTVSTERQEEFLNIFTGDMSEQELLDWIQEQPDADALQALLAVEINTFSLPGYLRQKD